ncbi:hypothetical protein SAVIM40S_04869 [Streptomyces avidinii]|uniref:Uncharacterized protein n=1 Tax=Streptomyces avidinii TaxID=1895 RepID=A0ABS4LE54_STRAV|nr:hypothetical protein [Streptomyces avidinii]
MAVDEVRIPGLRTMPARITGTSVPTTRVITPKTALAP